MTSERVFNGPVEVGLRLLVVLLEAFPRALELQVLVTLDYFLVHSGDVDDGPESLHPPSPLRSGEVAVRRALIEDGLNMYRARGLIAQRLSSAGFSYVADDSAGAFLDALTSPYVAGLRQRAQWAVERFGLFDGPALNRVLEGSFSRWRAEFAVLSAEGDDV